MPTGCIESLSPKQALKKRVRRQRGDTSAIWNTFVREARFCWDTGTSGAWDITEELFAKSGGNGGRFYRRGTIFRDLFVLRTFYANGVERLDRGDGCTQYFRNGKPGEKSNSGRIIAIKLEGYLPPCPRKNSVPNGMREMLVAAGIPAVCAISGTRDVEVDHKQGRPDGPNGWQSGADPTLYQFLSPANNGVKKSACKQCVKTGKRFDATMLGFARPWTEGGAIYNPQQGCKGCYWFDVRAFHAPATAPQEDTHTINRFLSWVGKGLADLKKAATKKADTWPWLFAPKAPCSSHTTTDGLP